MRLVLICTLLLSLAIGHIPSEAAPAYDPSGQPVAEINADVPLDDDLLPQVVLSLSDDRFGFGIINACLPSLLNGPQPYSSHAPRAPPLLTLAGL